ncbi:MAG: ADP-glyceromanno-heptose 6-epimerase [Calditrichia bacterium]|nr:ADP-glyceromanno-heptose 6-epimerase [Calditrichia bacterium]
MIIITGGAGFIGSVLARHLNNEGHNDILIVDSLKSNEKWKNLIGLDYSDYLEKEDFLEKLISGDFDKSNIDAIFHLGACSSTTEKDAAYLIKNNFEYSKILAQFALSLDIRFIYASSAATYGEGENGYSDKMENLNQLRPLNMYGYSKQMFDLWLKKHKVLDKVVGLKYFNVYGPNEYHKLDMRSVICKAVEQIKVESKLNLFKSYHPDYGHGEQKRDFVYVKDAVKMTAHFYSNNKTAGGIFNVGTGEAHTWNELGEAIFEGMGKKPDINYIDMPDYLRPKYQYYTKADNKKIIEAGYNNKITDFKVAVIDYVKNYLLEGKYITE